MARLGSSAYAAGNANPLAITARIGVNLKRIK
jgi:hypothetical protein